MAINTYVVKTGEFGQYDITDARPLSLSVFKNNGGLARSCNQVVWNMGRKRRTPVKKPKRPPPKKFKMSAKGGHDRSFQKRMEIAILASRGVKPARSEEVMQTGSAQFNQNERAKSDLILFLPHLWRRKDFTGSSRDQHRKSWRRN